MAHAEEMTDTIIVKIGEQVIRINASDFDAETMEVVDAPEPAIAAAPVADIAPVTDSAPVQLGVVKQGRKYFVVDAATSLPVDIEGIDKDGYKTDVEAIEAAQKVM